MSVTESTCKCGTTNASAAQETPSAISNQCTCGCCGTPAPKDAEIAELHRQRDALDRRLAELERV